MQEHGMNLKKYYDEYNVWPARKVHSRTLKNGCVRKGKRNGKNKKKTKTKNFRTAFIHATPIEKEKTPTMSHLMEAASTS